MQFDSQIKTGYHMAEKSMFPRFATFFSVLFHFESHIYSDNITSNIYIVFMKKKLKKKNRERQKKTEPAQHEIMRFVLIVV